MADQFFDDYLTGLNTGVAFNGASSLGAQHSYKPPSPAVTPPPVPASRHAEVLVPRQNTVAAPPGPPRKPRPPTFLDRWVWQLSDTLTSSFDRVADRLLKTRSWRAIWMLTGVLGAVGALNLGVAGPADHWSVTCFIAAVGALMGGAAPFILLALVRALFWVAGAAVQLSAALAVGAAVIGVAGATVYAIILALA